MQFFPDAFSLSSMTATVPVKAAQSAHGTFRSFHKILNESAKTEVPQIFHEIFESNAGTDSIPIKLHNIFTNLAEFNKSNTPGIAPGFRSVREDQAKITSRDLNALKGKLEEKGVPAQVLDQFMDQLNAFCCAPTVGNMMGAARELTGRQALELDERETLAFSALLGRMGFDQEEIGILREAVLAGDGKTILQAVEGKARQNAEIPTADQAFALSREDAALICRAADLSPKSGSQILAAFGEQQSLSLNFQELSSLFSTALAEKKQLEQEIVQLRENLPQALQTMFEQKKWEKDAPSSDNKSNRQAELLEVLARERATSREKSDDDSLWNGIPKNIQKDDQNGKWMRRVSIAANLQKPVEEDAARQPGQNTTAAATDAEKTSRAPRPEANPVVPPALPDEKKGSPGAINAEKPAIMPGTEQNPGQREAEKNLSGQFGQKESPARHQPAESRPTASNSADPAADKAEAALRPMAPAESGQQEIRKTEDIPNTRREERAASSETKTDITPMPSFQLNQAENTAAETRAAKTAFYQEQIFDQVEKGLVRSLTDGAKQIILRLDPPELGKLTLNLTMAQGEIKAVIRTENAATAEIISEQLSQLKTSLEEQGFKVSSLEVETRTQSHAGTDNWNGAEQHNQQQELREQANFLRLAHFRAREGELLAQSVQIEDQPASNSASGLHLIA